MNLRPSPDIRKMDKHRADCTTMLLVTVSAPDFFQYESFEQFLGRILEYIFQRFDDSLATHEFYKEAYTKMMQVFVEGLSSEIRTFKSIAHKTSAYQHFYNIYNSLPVARASSNSAPGANTGAVADANKKSASEVDRLRRALRVQKTGTTRRQTDRRQGPAGSDSSMRARTGQW